MEVRSSVVVAANRETFRKNLKEALARNGYDAIECARNEDVVSVLKSDSSVCLLMIEPSLEGGEETEGGVEAVRRIWRLEGKADFPVIFLIGRSSEMPDFAAEFRGTNTRLLSFPSPQGEFAAFLKRALGQ